MPKLKGVFAKRRRLVHKKGATRKALEERQRRREEAALNECVTKMTVCRVCAFDCDDSVEIFGSEGEDLFLAQKINDYLPIQVTATDALSLNVCRNCTTFLVAWDDLYTTCREADLQLKSAYEEACNSISTSEVQWKNITVVHDHSYNKNDTADGTTENDIRNDGTVSVQVKDQIIIQSIDLIDDDDDEAGINSINLNDFQVETSQDEISESAQIENLSKRRKVIHFEVVNAEGGTFSVNSLEMQQDDNEAEGIELLEQDHNVETLNDVDEDITELNDVEEEDNIDEVKDEVLEEQEDNEEDCDYVDDDELKEDDSVEEQIDDEDSCDVELPQPPKKTNLEPKVCDICHVVCKGNLALQKHRKTHPPEVRNKCPVCKKISPNDGSHKAHVKTHTDNLHPCDECGKILSSRSSLAVHKQTHRQERRYQCQICGKTTMTPAKLREHIQIHSDTRPFTCSHCNQSFKTQQCLKQHAATHNKQPLFVCDMCGYSCHRRNHLTKHVANRHKNPDDEKKPRMYSCCICNEAFPSRIPLVQHVMEQHPADEEGVAKAGILQCKQCGKVLTSKAGYHCHMATHSGRRHTCEFCGRTFATSKSLKYHILDHTGEKPFSCRTCGQSFKGQWLLQRHERVHTGERPYKCTECPMAFRCSMTLYQHKQIHSSVKKYKCAFCKYQTSRAEALRIHLRVHTDERPYPCSICGWAFKQKSDCSKHMALHNRPQGIKRQIKKIPQRKMEQLTLALPSSDIMDDNSEGEGATENTEFDALDIKAENLLTIDDSQLSMPDNTDSCD